MSVKDENKNNFILSIRTRRDSFGGLKWTYYLRVEKIIIIIIIVTKILIEKTNVIT